MNPQSIFATVVWNNIPSDEDVSWVARAAQQSIVKQPMGDYGVIIQDMLDKGVSEESIARFAKIVGYETAFSICYALEDPNCGAENLDPISQINWGLFQTDPETDEIVEQISGTHELLLSMDPRGNEMEPSTEMFSAYNKSHHDIVVDANTALRRKWLSEYVNTSQIEVFEFQSKTLPFQMEPLWPGRRVGFMLGFTDTDVWIMSSGLSNPEHPKDNVNWHRCVPLPAPEILSRTPIGSISRGTDISELINNTLIQNFLNIACIGLSLHLNEALRKIAHKAVDINDSHIFTNNPNLASTIVLFSDIESLEMAEPIPLSDHDYLRVPVHFATFVEQKDMTAINKDAFEYSKKLGRNELLGSITSIG